MSNANLDLTGYLPSATCFKLGMSAADFYIGVLLRLPESGPAVAIQLTKAFVESTTIDALRQEGYVPRVEQRPDGGQPAAQFSGIGFEANEGVEDDQTAGDQNLPSD